MKKYALVILCGIILSQTFILPAFFYNIKNIELTNALQSRNFYEQDDILFLVYDINCKNGIGGFTFEINYDGDNLDFYNIFTSGNYYTAFYDNSVGNVLISAINNDTSTGGKNYNESVKVAVGFKARYMLDASFISFSSSFLNFIDFDIKRTDSYFVEKSFYIYNSSIGDINEYINSIIKIDDNKTNKDTESDTDTQTDISSDTFDIKEYYYGDVDLDRKITSADILYILRYSVRLEHFTTKQIILGDIDGDGTVTSADSLEILRHSVGLKSNLQTDNVLLLDF